MAANNDEKKIGELTTRALLLAKALNSVLVSLEELGATPELCDGDFCGLGMSRVYFNMSFGGAL